MFLLDCKKKEIRHKKATKFRRIQLALSISKSWKKQILSIANIQKAFSYDIITLLQRIR